MNQNKKEICRLCYYETNDTTDIFSAKGTSLDYIGKIRKYLCFSVDKDDGLPNTVCWMCTQQLESFHRFYEKINDIQKMHLTQFEYDNIVLRPKYDIDHMVEVNKNNTIVDDDGNTIEVLVISEEDAEHEQKLVDNDFEEFELLEVDNVDANNEIDEDKMKKKENNEANESIELMETNELATRDIKNAMSPQTRSQRKSKLNAKSLCKRESRRKSVRQAAARIKREVPQKFVQTIVKSRKSLTNRNEQSEKSNSINSKDNCAAEETQHDMAEGESDDEFPSRDSYNDDWPSQETLSEFPKVIIKDGLLQVKGKELLSLICRFYNLECKLCEEKRRFKQLNDMLDHYTETHKEPGYVECCQVKLFRYQAIIMHMCRHLQPDAFKCNICGYIVTRPRFLQSHEQTHLPDDQKPYACEKCPRRFCWKNALRIHLISHKPAEERHQYICHVCGRTYDTPGGLCTHKKLVHSDIKKSQSSVCHICAKNFSSRTGLHEHMMTIHQPREKGQMQCTECGKWLMNFRCLKTHMVLHSDVQFRCDKCDYITKKKTLLNRHLVTRHSNKRPFVCDYCGRDFKMKRALTVHVAQHASTTKYQCPFCDRSFNSSTNFYTHRKNSHPKELAEMKQQEEAERRRRRIEAGVEEGELNVAPEQQIDGADIVQPIEVQVEDDDNATTFHVTEIRNTHLILTTETGDEYTVLEVKSHDNNDQT